MYEIYVSAEEFRGVRTVAQHRLVNDVSQVLV
jgi:stress-induced morphogen